MKPLWVDLQAKAAIKYPICIGYNNLSSPLDWLPKDIQHFKLVIITDESVKRLYGDKLIQQLEPFNPLLFSFPPGEHAKQLNTVEKIIDGMANHSCSRDTLVLALGGGVVGDIAGFVAAIYCRGIPYIQIPTSLLAMVDSSIGGKTGLDLPQGKNLVGAFWHPSMVLIDLSCLTTLPKVQKINGLIESFKIFLTSDKESVAYFCQSFGIGISDDYQVLEKIIRKSIELKAEIVARDELETNERMVLNFGHTIGHAIERLSNYKMLHGYAVGLGILIEARISLLLHLLSQKDYETIKGILLQLGIQKSQLQVFDTHKLIEATRSDKKNKSNQIRFVLLSQIGQVHTDTEGCFVHVVSEEVVKKALDDKF